MQMLYNSDSYIVVHFEVPAAPLEAAASDALGLTRGGFEIVDKLARQEIFIEGAVAAGFKAGVEALIERDPSPEDFDAFIESYTTLGRQPLALH